MFLRWEGFLYVDKKKDRFRMEMNEYEVQYHLLPGGLIYTIDALCGVVPLLCSPPEMASLCRKGRSHP